MGLDFQTGEVENYAMRSHKIVTRNLLILIQEKAEIITDSSSLNQLHAGVMKWFHLKYLLKCVPLRQYSQRKKKKRTFS